MAHMKTLPKPPSPSGFPIVSASFSRCGSGYTLSSRNIICGGNLLGDGSWPTAESPC